MSLSDTAIINTVPAANNLRKVSGFNPLSYLRKCVSAKTGQPVLRLDLTHKKLWFRLAYPNGRMVLNPLRITDQLAIFEAQVYLSKDDKEPFSRFTSSVSLSEAGKSNYVKAAQEAALNEALESAGFGIQLCDIAEVEGSSEYGSEVPVELMSQPSVAANASPAASSPSIAESAPPAAIARDVPTEQAAPTAQTPPNTQPAPLSQEAPVPQIDPVSPVQRAAPVAQNAPVAQPAPVQQVATVAAPEVVAQAIPAAPTAPEIAPLTQEQSVQSPVAAPNAQAAQVLPATVQESVAAPGGTAPAAISEAAVETPAQQNVGEPITASAPAAAVAQEPSSLEQLLANTQPRVINFPTQAPPAENAVTPQNVEMAPEVPENAAEAPAGYTPDMSVEDIMARMTLEEAQSVVVTTGTCKGWTLGQVAQSRAPSLKFYVCSGNSDNVLKAASKIVLEDLALKKAG